jgi:DNA primase
MINLMLWETNDSLFPLDPEERMKLIISMAENVKAELDSGVIKTWGISAAGGRGFSISEEDPKAIYARTSRFFPFIKFEIIPMLSIDEMINTMKEMQQ